MSEADDREVIDLIDRAGAHSPPLHLDRQDVVARGRQIVRRRRSGGAGMAVAGLALAGTAWLGLGGGLVGSPSGVQPAATAPEATDPPAARGPVGEGEQVTLLGERYEVAVDRYGWPQLLEADGTVFITVSEPDGPPAGDSGGGVAMWREHWWWPWSDHHEVHFAYSHDGRPSLPAVGGRERVTITGPEGEVLVVAVPAGS